MLADATKHKPAARPGLCIKIEAASSRLIVLKLPASNSTELQRQTMPIVGRAFLHISVYSRLDLWTCPRMTGHAVALRLVNLVAGETRAVSSISG
ncbi:hypothetical protein, partial [Paraburkholderia phenoliruptrix]|uniref:hypothetical protein n=1 Tax=Paraburkholderia phenoliruptrix TaxID=252970 RepID=UPI00286D42A1